ncbi:MAG: polysaccharide deacetylase family protein [Chitinophagaceae bacterium]
MKNSVLAFAICSLLFSCADNNSEKATSEKISKDSSVTVASPDTAKGKMADAATILARKQVPVLCYHHIRDIQMPGKATSGYEVTEAEFNAQMKILSDSGYHSILPDQYYNYLAYGTPLPTNPVMITFDDTDVEQFTIGKREMDKYGFKGVYFLMTISIGRPRYMNKEQIKQLADEGHAVEAHTWDHSRVDRYKSDNVKEIRGVKKQVNDYDLQLIEPKKTIEAITGKPVNYFAYPFGIWSPTALQEIKKRDYKLAFILSTQRDSTDPLFTVRRMIISPTWSAPGVLRVMQSTFK